jgi:hypothetical protein
MSANRGPLKPGTPCWLTKTVAANIGKVVEVVSFIRKVGQEDLYECLSKEPMITQLMAIDTTTGLSIVIREYQKPAGPLQAFRCQLIPIIDPNQPVEDKENLLDEIQSITVRNASVK